MRVYLIDHKRVDRKEFIKELMFSLYEYFEKNESARGFRIYNWVLDTLSNNSPQISTVVDGVNFVTFIDISINQVRMIKDFKTPICNFELKKGNLYELHEDRDTAYLVTVPECKLKLCVPKHCCVIEVSNNE